MNTLNLIAVILGIVASLGTLLSLYLQHRSPAPPPPAGQAPVISPPRSTLRPRSQGLRKLSGVFWGVLGAASLLEGLEFGETFLLLLGCGFLGLAYWIWPRPTTASTW